MPVLSLIQEEIRGLKQQLNELQHLEPQILDESLMSPVAHSIVSGEWDKMAAKHSSRLHGDKTMSMVQHFSYMCACMCLIYNILDMCFSFLIALC